MSNSPTLPPVAGPQRKPTTLPPSALSTESDDRMQAALAASARAQASLTGLSRAIQHLGTGLGSAHEANESLTTELEALRDLLSSANEQQQLFEVKIEQLELVLDRTRREHAQERGFLIDQQDTFLVKLLDEHEVELKRRDIELDVLRGRLAELERRELVTVPPPLLSLPSLSPSLPLDLATQSAALPSEREREERAQLERTAQKLSEDRERARETVSRLQAQRDEAQTAVARISKERDEALYMIHRLRAELGGPRIPPSTRPPPAEMRRDSGLEPATWPQASSSSAPPVSATASPPSVPSISSVLSPPRSNPDPVPLPTRLSPLPSRISQPPSRQSPPPEELRRALTAPPAVQSAASSRPPLKQKPDASTRPLVGYSVGNESIEPEHFEGVRLSSKPSPPSSEKP